MARKLGTFMFYVRFFQLLMWFAILIENGWLTDHILRKRLGFGNNMAVVEWFAGFGTSYTLLQIFILHHSHKSSRPRYLIIFVIADVLFMGLVIANMSILSVAGVPNNCQNLTRQNYLSGDTPNNPALGYTTIRFGSGPGSPGELDKYCNLPRSAYGLCIFGIYTYMTSIILAILRTHRLKYICHAPDAESKPTLLTPKYSSTSLDTLPAPTPTAPAQLTQVQSKQTTRHELPTPNNTTELESPVSELHSPLSSPADFPVGSREAIVDDDDDEELAQMEPSISNGSRGARMSMAGSRTAGLNMSVGNGGPPPPAYMPASEGTVGLRCLSVGDAKKT